MARASSTNRYRLKRLQMMVKVCSSPVEAALLQATLLVGRHLDVGRREEQDLVGRLLQVGAQRVGGAAAEVDDSVPQVALHVLEVDDHRLVVLQPVADLLGVVEARRV